jgi:hypothetical protein
VTVYVTTMAGAHTNGIPTPILAVATTGFGGTWSATIPGLPAGTSLGYVAVNGSTISPVTGTTDTGYTIAHAVGSASSNVTLLVDRLSGDEQSGFTAVNNARTASLLPAIAADTLAQAAARLAVAQRVGASQCGDASPSAAADFFAFGGYGPSGAASWEDTAGPDWAAIYNYQSPWNTSSIPYAGLAALYQETPCGTGYATTINYFEGMYAL